jgi:hypothetical protein
VAADPEPDYIVAIGNPKRTIVKLDTRGPIMTGSLEV